MRQGGMFFLTCLKDKNKEIFEDIFFTLYRSKTVLPFFWKMKKNIKICFMYFKFYFFPLLFDVSGRCLPIFRRKKNKFLRSLRFIEVKTLPRMLLARQCTRLSEICDFLELSSKKYTWSTEMCMFSIIEQSAKSLHPP